MLVRVGMSSQSGPAGCAPDGGRKAVKAGSGGAEIFPVSGGCIKRSAEGFPAQIDPVAHPGWARPCGIIGSSRNIDGTVTPGDQSAGLSIARSANRVPPCGKAPHKPGAAWPSQDGPTPGLLRATTLRHRACCVQPCARRGGWSARTLTTDLGPCACALRGRRWAKPRMTDPAPARFGEAPERTQLPDRAPASPARLRAKRPPRGMRSRPWPRAPWGGAGRAVH